MWWRYIRSDILLERSNNFGDVLPKKWENMELSHRRAASFTPNLACLARPLIRLLAGWGYPSLHPDLGRWYPPPLTWDLDKGRYPQPEQHNVYLLRRWPVCLLRSRRTFLFQKSFSVDNDWSDMQRSVRKEGPSQVQVSFYHTVSGYNILGHTSPHLPCRGFPGIKIYARLPCMANVRAAYPHAHVLHPCAQVLHPLWRSDHKWLIHPKSSVFIGGGGGIARVQGCKGWKTRFSSPRFFSVQKVQTSSITTCSVQVSPPPSSRGLPHLHSQNGKWHS